ncbi:CaiB/BaiF CoA transferase family protein [Noviherbaspirillum sp. Root189]|uniref:CaiB/BaiF CoA transferase family protein n=1 Tax=Noviherbaspirillum sp. Root189 TaxID=1736487 RepID=UPI00070F67B8|nr:CoA transferase [Noviherbaspirillum sp. Root189]KRB70598.1 acyl-CoA transferase [Noviherbaspirillum sp. Root189]
MLPAEQLSPAPNGKPLSLLEGIRVLDLTTSIAGPYASLLLADFGAEVVKIERPGRGDDARAWGPPFLDGESLWFLSVNRNKHSVTLDYAQSAGLDVLHSLVKVADVIIVNQVGKSQKKLGIDYARLSEINPRLVHVSITGFGLDGAKKDQPCYDLIAEGYSGVMDLTGASPESEPQKVGTPAADLLSGSDAAMAVLAALLDRSRTGNGHEIDIAMVESMTRFMTPRIVPYLGSGELSRRSGGTDSVIAIYQTFHTADHPITLGLGNDAIWKRFCDVVGRPDMAQDPRFADNAGRRAARSEIVRELQKMLLEKPSSYWLDAFASARIPSGPINRLDQVVTDPTLTERGLFYATRRNGVAVPQVGLGIRFNGNFNTHRKDPPRLGEDTRQAFHTWLGWDDDAIQKLDDAGLL